MSEERALADRMSSYGDAVAAFSLVNTLGFFAAIAEVETRCALEDNRLFVVAIMFVVQSMYVAAVIGLRRTEVRLRTGIESSEVVTHFREAWHRARVIFTVVIAFLLALLAWLTIGGDSCQHMVQ